MPDEVVVITGANGGSGSALTRSLHSAGFRVAGLDLSGDNVTGIKHLPCT